MKIHEIFLYCLILSFSYTMIQYIEIFGSRSEMKAMHKLSDSLRTTVDNNWADINLLEPQEIYWGHFWVK